MSEQAFSYKDYSPAPDYYIPADDDLDAEPQPSFEYGAESKRLDTDTLMLLVAERFSDSDALRVLVEDTKRVPFTPGDRRALHVSEAMRLGDALAAILADVMDEQIEMRLAAADGRAA